MRAGDKVKGGIKDDLQVSGQVLEPKAFLVAQHKEPSCQCRRLRFKTWIRKMPGRRNWQPTPVFLPGRSHGQRSLGDCSPGGRKRVGHDLPTKQYSFSKHLLILCTLDQVPIQMMGIEDKKAVSSPF